MIVATWHSFLFYINCYYQRLESSTSQDWPDYIRFYFCSHDLLVLDCPILVCSCIEYDPSCKSTYSINNEWSLMNIYPRNIYSWLYHSIFSELLYLLCHRMLFKFIYMLNRFGSHNIFLPIIQRSSLCHVTCRRSYMTDHDWFRYPTALWLVDKLWLLPMYLADNFLTSSFHSYCKGINFMTSYQ